jgi:hypothetical protein
MIVKVLRIQSFLLLMQFFLRLDLSQTLIQERLYSREQTSWHVILAFVLICHILVSTVRVNEVQCLFANLLHFNRSLINTLICIHVRARPEN